MQERDESAEAPRPRLTKLKCRRTGDWYGPEEHAQCPWCFGRLAEVEEGQHETFCDWREKKDPISFGFPPGSTRDRSG